MHCALAIPEIIQHVLSSGVCRITARNAALTCGLWKDLALDELWKDLDSIFPLLWVLVPLQVDTTAPRDKKTIWTAEALSPLPEDWNRLETYARRVRTLIFDISPTTGNTFDLSMFQTVIQLRPSGKDLLPNLRKFTYNARQQSSPDALPLFLTFLGASIVELKLLQIVPMVIPDFLANLSQKVPQVQHLRIERSSQSDAGSMALVSSLIRLERLSSLDVAPVALTPAIWDAMAQHPSLLSATFSEWKLSPDAIGFQPRTFANLRSLAIQANFDHLCGLFESQNDLPTLTRIAFRGLSVEQGRNDLRRLCGLLAQKLPILRWAGLVCRSKTSHSDVPLGFEDFRPILQCKNLESFWLAHPCGVSVTVNEVGELLDALPHIHHLALHYASHGADPEGRVRRVKLNWTPPTLPLSVVDIVAAKRPKIKQLRLSVDATAPIASTPGIRHQQFECLEELVVTLSTVAHPENVAKYLVQRSRKRFPLKFVSQQKVQKNVVHVVDEEKKKWKQVEEHLRLLFDQKEELEGEFKRRIGEER
ncbi:hypothetical protein M407DRAFT_19540, partial [Tulasnella calospora MUT 4182]